MDKDEFNLAQIKASKYGEYFAHLQNITEKQDRDLLINKKVIQILTHDYRKNLNQLLSELLKYFKNDHFSSIRIVVKNQKLNDGESISAEGIGIKCGDYAYLDEQVEDQLGKPGLLYISDTTRIHSIKFISGNKFPRTVLGISLKSETEKSGFIWFACEEQKNFTKFESDSLVSLVKACASVIFQCVEWNEINENLSFQNKVFDLILFPVFIFSRNAVIFSNSAAKQIIEKTLKKINQKEEFIKKIWDFKTEKNDIISINERDYKIRFIDTIQKFPGPLRAVVLMDDTSFQQQKNYLTLVLDSLSQGLRSPLNLILGSVKMLPLVGDVNDHQKKYINSIQQKTEDSLAIIEELFDLERVIKNNGFRIQEIDIKSLVDISSALVGHLSNQKRISIINKSPNSDELIKVDKILFTQMLANIFEYAIGQTGLGGEIGFTSENKAEKWRITIDDSGNGLSQVEVDNLNSNENLHRIPSSLLLVRSIVSFHGGTFKIQSDFGKGNTYIIEIPKNS